ncbi:hypothetical protein D1BOALGB6SA_7192 [Olavius sp. associated proteobacterium Delta 1]|nr:hypothetical protein D1BOALGB6SA_7192 [Olavius sp. associated proteobacterium Delta 1]
MVDLSNFTIIERTFSGLSLAIRLFDRCATGLTPFGGIDLSLKNSGRKVVRNPSGNFVYLNLDEGNYRVSIKSDYYLEKKFDVSIPLLSSPSENQNDKDVKIRRLDNAVIASVDLLPDVNYPFPSGATLIRGEVIKKENGIIQPVSGAIVRITDSSTTGTESRNTASGETELEFAANRSGQFVLYMNKFEKKKIIEINGKKLGGRKIDQKSVLRLWTILPVLSNAREVQIEYGKTTYTTIEI